MTAEWHPDPLGRAEFRYFDGTAWTHHVATNGLQSVESPELPLQALAPPAPPPTPAPTPGGGRLIAAGVLAIVSGTFTVLISVVVFVLAGNPNAFNNCTDPTVCTPRHIDNPGALVVGGVFFLIIGALFIVAGIGGCMRKHWGQIMIITVGALGVLLYLVVLAVRGRPQMIIPIVWFATVAGLAVGIDRKVFEQPSNR